MGQYTVKKCILKNEEGEFLSPFVIPASNEEIGTVKPDGKSIIISEDGTIEAKNVLIAGDNIQIDENNLLTASGGKDLFDVVMKDHILTYEEKKGYELLGEYVYKSAIAGERYGYPDFYNKCLEEYSNATIKKTWFSNNIIPIELIKQNESILSNFSADNYATLNLKDNSFLDWAWTINVKFRLTANNVVNPIISCSKNYGGLHIYIDKNGKLNIYMSGDGSSWEAVDNGRLGTNVYAAETDYWLKISGSVPSSTGIMNYSVQYSTDGETYTTDWWEQLMPLIYKDGEQFLLGRDYSGNYLHGIIDLEETNIVGIWNGSSYVNIYENENGHLFYEITDKETIDKYYQENGVAWFYGIDEENERISLPRNDY